MVKTKYVLDKTCTVYQLEEEGFHYNYELDCWMRLYPVMFYNGKQHVPVVYLRVLIDLEEQVFNQAVVINKNLIDSTYYTEYGNRDTYMAKIDKNSIKVLCRLCSKHILKKWGKRNAFKQY